MSHGQGALLFKLLSKPKWHILAAPKWQYKKHSVSVFFFFFSPFTKSNCTSNYFLIIQKLQKPSNNVKEAKVT